MKDYINIIQQELKKETGINPSIIFNDECDQLGYRFCRLYFTNDESNEVGVSVEYFPDSDSFSPSVFTFTDGVFESYDIGLVGYDNKWRQENSAKTIVRLMRLDAFGATE